MKNGYLARLLLLVSIALIGSSEQDCNEYFNLVTWSKFVSPVEPITLVQPKDSKDIMECSLERMCLERESNICCILRDCFDRPKCSQIGSNISEKCKGENFTTIQFFHFMCLTANAVDDDSARAHCDDYGTLCDIYTRISFSPTTHQTTLPPTTNATLPESTTITTTARLPLTTTTLRTTTTKATTKATPIPSGNNSGQVSNSKGSSETLTLKILLLIFVMFSVAGPLLVYLRMRHRRGPMIPQNGMNGTLPQTDTQLESETPRAIPNRTEEAHLMKCLSDPSPL